MDNGGRTIAELRFWQSRPLIEKVFKAQETIKNFVSEFQKYTLHNFYTGQERTVICGQDDIHSKITKDEDIIDWTPAAYISFSGGKDSTVLLHIARQMYPEIEAVFLNTRLGYPEKQSFAKSFENVTPLRPRMRFDEVIREFGYPIIGKDVALTIQYARQGSQWALNNLNGLDNKGRPHEYKKNMYSKYKPLTEVDFMISSNCCRVMKEQPLDDFAAKTGKKSIVATLAAESERREKAWLKTGCNVFDSKNATSKPLSLWTEQDVLLYIKENNLPMASVYGEIVYEGADGLLYENSLCEGGKLCTTGCDRTGCIFCGFGLHLEKGETRFQRLKRTHPRQYEYCLEGGAYDADGLWKPANGGLGMKHVFDECNKIYGNDFIRYY